MVLIGPLSLRITPLYAQPEEVQSCPRLTLRYVYSQLNFPTPAKGRFNSATGTTSYSFTDVNISK